MLKDDIQALRDMAEDVFFQVLGDQAKTQKLLDGLNSISWRVHYFMHPKMESEMERKYFYTWLALDPKPKNFYRQLPVGYYVLDFAYVNNGYKLAIEIDGHEHHSSKQARAKDAARDRYMHENGWETIRFTGSEIYKDALKCVEETIRIIQKRTGIAPVPRLVDTNDK